MSGILEQIERVRRYKSMAGPYSALITEQGDGNNKHTTIELSGDQFELVKATKKIVVIGEWEWSFLAEVFATVDADNYRAVMETKLDTEQSQVREM